MNPEDCDCWCETGRADEVCPECYMDYRYYDSGDDDEIWSDYDYEREE